MLRMTSKGSHVNMEKCVGMHTKSLKQLYKSYCMDITYNIISIYHSHTFNAPDMHSSMPKPIFYNIRLA